MGAPGHYSVPCYCLFAKVSSCGYGNTEKVEEGNPAGEAEWRWRERKVREDISAVIPTSPLCL